MDKFPLRIKEFFFTKTVIESIPGFSVNEEEPELPNNNIDVGKIESQETEEAYVYGLTMRTTLNLEKKTSYPYMMDMECVVYFYVDKDESEQEAKKGVTITGHNVAYGAIREAVSWITGRHPYGTIQLGLSLLPTKDKKEA